MNLDRQAWIDRARAVPIMHEIERRGIKLKRVGAEYIGPCPLCGGTDRFSVNANKKVWNCRGCRIGGDVIDLVQHLDGGTFDQNIATLAGPPTNSKSNGKHHSAEPRPIVVAEYLYHDENGVVLFGVDRIHYQNADGTFVMKDGKYQKSFIQKRPDPAHPGKWLKGVKDKDGNRLVRNVPYHLPGMIEAAANDHPIVIVEGEAKADLLATWNICATCNAGGAKHWGPEHSAFFKDADVIILPDNDSAGFEHTDVVGRSLTGIAKRIRRLALPNLSPKGDILNWAQVGHTREQLDAEIAKAPDWTPSATTDATPEQPEQSEVPHLDVFDAGDDIELPPPRGWLLGNQFCRGFLSSLVAPGAAGKTALRIAQLLSLATARSLTGQHVFVRCRVLLLSFEDGRDELQRRLTAALLHHNINRSELKGWLYYATPKNIKLAELENGSPHRGMLEQELRTRIEELQPDIVCLDPFVKTHALEENNSGSMDFVCDLLATFADEFNIAVDAPHHSRKGIITPGDADMGRGSSSIRDAGRLVYTLTPMDEAEARQFSIEQTERRSFVRLDSAKVNIARPASAATWFKLVSVNIGNATKDYPAGDEVQTVQPWKPPDTWASISAATLNAVLTDIEAGLPNGQRFTNAPAAAPARAVWRLVQKHVPSHGEAQCRQIISAWLDNGVLYPEKYDDPIDRKSRQGLRLDPAKRPS